MLLVIPLTILMKELKKKKNAQKKYFLPRVDITNCNVLIDSRNFYDQLIGDQIKNNDEIKNIAIGKGYVYITECLLDYISLLYFNF